MYKIVGADGKEYGPISADQVRQWIAEGRANGQTRALADGATEWKVLAELPEFAAALAAKAGPPPAMKPLPPQSGPGDADILAKEILARDYQLQIGHCIGRGWDLMTQRFWLTVGASFLIGLLNIFGAIPIVGPGLMAVLFGGLCWMFLRLIRGQSAEVGDAFSGFSLAFLPLFLCGIVTHLLTLVGVLLCILPGIYLAVAWMFGSLLIIDRKLDFWQAMELSRKVVSRHWWQLFGLVLLCGLVLVAGTLACCVGSFIAQPVVVGAIVYAYEDIFGAKPVPAALLPVTPPAAAPLQGPQQPT